MPAPQRSFSRVISLLLIIGVIGLLVFVASHWREIVEPKPMASSAAGDYLAGYVAAHNNDYQSAAIYLKDSLAYHPKDVGLLTNAYSALLLSGQISEAIMLANQYMKSNPSELTGSVLPAMEELRKEHYLQAKAIIDANNANATALDKVVVPFIDAWCLVGGGRTDEAIALLKKNSAADKDHDQFITYELALINDLAGRNDAAEKYYEQVKEGNDKSYRYVRNAANFYERIGKKDKARALYQGYDIDSDTPSSNSSNNDSDSNIFAADIRNLDEETSPPERTIVTAKDGIIDVMLEIVGSLYKVQLYKSGMTYLQMIIYLDPDVPQANYMLGNYYQQQGQYSKAILYLQKVQHHSEFYWQSQLSIAGSFFKMNENRHAKKLLKALIDERPYDIDAPMLLADILRSQHDYKAAGQVYDHVIDQLKKPKSDQWYIFYLRGINEDEGGNWDKAQADFDRALALHPDQPDILNYEGYTYLIRHENIAKATAMIRKALDQQPDNVQFIDSMGWALYQSGHYPEALVYLEKAIAEMPYDSTINDHLGDIYWRLGRRYEAQFQWNHALSFSPEKQDEIAIRKKLEDGLPDTDMPKVPLDEKAMGK